MAAVVTGSSLLGFSVVSTDSGTGFTKQTQITLPVGLQAIAFANGTAAGQIAAMALWSGRALVASTPVTDDLTALSGYDGPTTVFAKIKVFGISNNEVANSGKDLTFSGGASNPWVGKLGGTTPTYTIKAGESLVMIDLSTAGMTVDGTHKTFKLDPGANNISVSIGIGGN